MNKPKLRHVLPVIAALALSPGCKKEDDPCLNECCPPTDDEIALSIDIERELIKKAVKKGERFCRTKSLEVLGKEGVKLPESEKNSNKIINIIRDKLLTIADILNEIGRIKSENFFNMSQKETIYENDRIEISCPELSKLQAEIEKIIYENEYILLNPRFLSMIKSFERFFSLSGYIVNCKNLSPMILSRLAKSDKESIRRAVAGNPHTSAETLLELSNDRDSKVREELARRPNIPIEILKKLSKDNDYYVRSILARNKAACTEEVLEILSKDNDKDVRIFVSRNVYTPKELLIKLSKDSSYDIRYLVAENENTPEAVLEELSDDKDSFVRSRVAINKNTKYKVLMKLLNDEHEDVRKLARRNLESRNEFWNRVR